MASNPVAAKRTRRRPKPGRHSALRRHCRSERTCHPKTCNQNFSRGPKRSQQDDCRNQQYSIVALTNSAAGIVERYAYSAYGEPDFTNASGTVLSESGKDNRNTFTGREWDDDLSLYHFRARLYDAECGSFCGRDPIGYEEGSALYKNNFIPSFVDPSGNWVCKCECTEWSYSAGSTLPYHSSSSYETQFIVAAGNPSQQTAASECSSRCDVDVSSAGPSCGNGKSCSGSIVTKWTTDETKAFALCSRINYSLGKCSDCTQTACEEVVLHLTEAIDRTWLFNFLGTPLGPQTCSRWANQCIRRLPELEENPCVASAYVQMVDVDAYLGLTSAHFFVKIILCDGTAIYADNGAWGGGDHIFFEPDPTRE